MHTILVTACFIFVMSTLMTLKRVLSDNKIPFETEGEIRAVNHKTKAASIPRCSVAIENNEVCGNVVEKNQAGLCQKHYREYLVFKINENYIDPLPLFNDTLKLSAILIRNGISAPPRINGEVEKSYQLRLQQYIKKFLPLKKIKGNMFNHSRILICEESYEIDHEEKEQMTREMLYMMIMKGEATYCKCGMICQRESSIIKFYCSCKCGQKLHWPKQKRDKVANYRMQNVKPPL